MSKQEVFHSYKISLNVSIATLALLCAGLTTLITLNNPEAIQLFFYRPALFAVGALILSFIVVPIVTIAVGALTNFRKFSVTR